MIATNWSCIFRMQARREGGLKRERESSTRRSKRKEELDKVWKVYSEVIFAKLDEMNLSLALFANNR